MRFWVVGVFVLLSINEGENNMKRLFILTAFVLSFLSVNVYGWEMYVSNESSNSITVYDQAGVLINTITDPSISQPRGCQVSTLFPTPVSVLFPTFSGVVF